MNVGQRLFSGALAFLLLFLFGLLSARGETIVPKVRPVVEQGVLDLSAWSFAQDGSLALRGEWNVYPGQLVDFDNIDNAPFTGDVAQIGALWNGPRLPFMSVKQTQDVLGAYTAMIPSPGGRHSAKGVATYQMTVMAAETEDVAIRLPAVSSASVLSVNGIPVVRAGSVAAGATKTVEEIYPQYARFTLQAGTSVVLWQVANMVHVRGGPTEAPVIATVDQIEQAISTSTGMEMFFVGVLIGFSVLFVFAAIFGRSMSAFWLACAGLSAALYIGLSGEVYLGKLLLADWLTIMRLKYAAVFVGIPAFLLAVKFSNSTSFDPLSFFALITGILMAVATFIQPPLLFGDLIFPFVIIMVVSGAVLLISSLIYGRLTHLAALSSVLIAAILSGLALFGFLETALPFGQLGAVIALTLMTVSHFSTLGQAKPVTPFATAENADQQPVIDESYDSIGTVDQSVEQSADPIEEKMDAFPIWPDEEEIQSAFTNQDQDDDDHQQEHDLAVYYKQALDRIGDGALLLDTRHVIVYCTPAYRRLRDLPLSLTRPGLPYQDLVTFLARRGDLGSGEPEALVQEAMSSLVFASEVKQNFITTDNLVIEQWSSPTDEGGWIMICRDLTSVMAWKWQANQNFDQVKVMNESVSEPESPQTSMFEEDDDVLAFADETDLEKQSESTPEVDSTISAEGPWVEEVENEVSENLGQDGVFTDQGDEKLDVFADGGPELPEIPDMEEDMAVAGEVSEGDSFTEKDTLDSRMVEEFSVQKSADGFVPSALIAPDGSIPLGQAQEMEVIDLRSQERDDMPELSDKLVVDSGLDENMESEDHSNASLADLDQDKGNPIPAPPPLVVEESILDIDQEDQEPIPDKENLDAQIVSVDAEIISAIKTEMAGGTGENEHTSLAGTEESEQDFSGDTGVRTEVEMDSLTDNHHGVMESIPDKDALSMDEISSLLEEDAAEDVVEAEPLKKKSPFDRAVDPHKPLPLNLSTLESVYGSDIEGAKDLLSEQLTRVEVQLGQLESLILAGKGQEAKSIARSVRGSSKAIGLDSLVHAVAGVEGALASGAWMDAVQAVHVAQDARKAALKVMHAL